MRCREGEGWQGFHALLLHPQLFYRDKESIVQYYRRKRVASRREAPVTERSGLPIS